MTQCKAARWLSKDSVYGGRACVHQKKRAPSSSTQLSCHNSNACMARHCVDSLRLSPLSTLMRNREMCHTPDAPHAIVHALRARSRPHGWTRPHHATRCLPTGELRPSPVSALVCHHRTSCMHAYTAATLPACLTAWHACMWYYIKVAQAAQCQARNKRHFWYRACMYTSAASWAAAAHSAAAHTHCHVARHAA